MLHVLFQSVRPTAMPLVGILALCGGLLVGCTKTEQPKTTTPPALVYTGPEFLHGSIGSITTLRGTQPQLVSGYGLVVELDGTGSTEVPERIRAQFVNEIRKQGVTNVSELLDNNLNTAVVQVKGFIPPGAIRGDRFDLLVEALPETQTTSLRGGKLWTCDLSVGGANPTMDFRTKVAEGAGPIYVDPSNVYVSEADPAKHHRVAAIIGGGEVKANRRLELILNQPSWGRASYIASRINDRFRHEKATEFFNTAVAMSNQVIQLNIPAEYQGRPADLVDLISHLYLDRRPQFQENQARYLLNLMQDKPEYADDVVLAIHAMGKLTLPVLREFYDHEDEFVGVHVLEAGARLSDEYAARKLDALARVADVKIRRQVIRVLGYLPDSLQASRTLTYLLNDSDRENRLAAYETLVKNDDPIIERFVFGTQTGLKFVLDLVPSGDPLVYAAYGEVPRIALFNPSMRLKQPLLASVWDGRLMLKGDDRQSDKGLVYYQSPGTNSGKQYEISTSVAELTAFLGHRASDDFPQPGLNLSYSQVVDALYELHAQDMIEGEMVIERSELAESIALYEKERYGTGSDRSETDRAIPQEGAPLQSEGGFVPLDPRGPQDRDAPDDGNADSGGDLRSE